MKRSFAAAVGLLALVAQAQALNFGNLNFEQAQVPPPPNLPVFVSWGDGAPGWSHSGGSDTGVLYYGTVHVGSTQWFALTSAPPAIPSWVLEGQHSLAFRNGYESPPGPNVPFVHAVLSQTGTIPEGTRSLRLMAQGPLGVFFGETPIPLVSLGGGTYGADIAAFAGQTRDLRLVNLADNLSDIVVVDNIVFSPLPVPELPTLSLFALGLAAWVAAKRRT